MNQRKAKRIFSVLCLAALAVQTSVCVARQQTVIDTTKKDLRVIGDSKQVRPQTDDLADVKPDVDPALLELGLDGSEQSIRDYLSQLRPNAQTEQLVGELVRQLNHADYASRQSATRHLMRLPHLPMSLLNAVSQADSPEAAYRIAKVVKYHNDPRRVRVQRAVFQFVRRQQLSGLFHDVLNSIPELNGAASRQAAIEALTEIASVADSPQLIQLLEHSDDDLVQGAIAALLRLQGRDFVPELKRLASHPAAGIRLEVAKSMAKVGEPECLDLFVDLLGDASPANRTMAAAALRGITGQRFQFAAYNQPDARAVSIEKWRDWISANRNEIVIEWNTVQPRLGRTLITLYNEGKIIEIDDRGTVVWEAQADHPFACQGLPNGHRLVALYTKGTLIEYDAEGEEFKRFTGLPQSLSGVFRMQNGNTLLAAGQSGQQLCEIDSEGTIVWKREVEGTPTYAAALESGNFLCSLYASDKVIEIDREGQILAELKVDGKPYSASRLPNGNTLVAFAKSNLAEYAPTGEKVWELETGQNAYFAQRLENGHTLYADEHGVHTVDQDGKEISAVKNYTGYVYAFAY